MVRACVNPILTDFFTTSLAYPLPAGPRRARPHAYMGQDLDECVDPSALAIAEYVSEPTLTVDPATREALFRCSLALRHMESPALGTPYPDVAARAREVAQHPRIEGRCTFVIDANGPGAGAMSLFTSPEFPAPLIAIKATGARRRGRRRVVTTCRSRCYSTDWSTYCGRRSCGSRWLPGQSR